MPAQDDDKTLVTVTGAAGFIALHCIRELLERGYRVSGTVRQVASEARIRRALLPLDPGSRLSFVRAELLDDAGWAEAMSGAKYALHVASPLPKGPPRDEQELIRPAREGCERVLSAARAAGVRRVVMTSSVAAISSGHANHGERVFTERDWSDLNGPIGAYEKSKTLAERAAWDFVARAKGELELVCMNPAYVLGPSLSGAENTSNEIVGKLLRRDIPGCPRLYFGLVDVRDVATAHVLGMLSEQAVGERFILLSDNAWMKEIARTLLEAGYRVPVREVPDFLVRLISWFDPTVRLIVHRVGRTVRMSSEKAEKLLGWSGRSMREMTLDTAADMAKAKQPGN